MRSSLLTPGLRYLLWLRLSSESKHWRTTSNREPTQSKKPTRPTQLRSPYIANMQR